MLRAICCAHQDYMMPVAPKMQMSILFKYCHDKTLLNYCHEQAEFDVVSN